jgi:hypothetical protein
LTTAFNELIFFVILHILVHKFRNIILRSNPNITNFPKGKRRVRGPATSLGTYFLRYEGEEGCDAGPL